MGDYIVVHGDDVLFECNFGDAIVMIKPGKMKGSGPATWKNKKLCVDGDEKNVEVGPCNYITGTYCLKPGMGKMYIKELDGAQKAQHTMTDGKKVILLGQNFKAEFKVMSPAQAPPKGTAPPETDTKTSYDGQGKFLTTNKKFKGT